MAAERQLVVAVEGTAALGPYWSAILGDYVEKIVRYARAPLAPGPSPLLFCSRHRCFLSALASSGSSARERRGKLGCGRCFRGNFFLILR